MNDFPLKTEKTRKEKHVLMAIHMYILMSLYTSVYTDT